MNGSQLITPLTLQCHRSGTPHPRSLQACLRLTSSTIPCTHQYKGLTDISPIPSPQSNTGDQLLPTPTYEAAASQFVSTPNQRKELLSAHFLTGSITGHPSLELRFQRRLPAGTSHLHTPLLAHRGRRRLRWADAVEVCLNLRPDEHARECVCPTNLVLLTGETSFDVNFRPRLVLLRPTSIWRRPSVCYW